MPEMPLYEDDELHPLVPSVLRATKLFPCDEKERERYLVASIIEGTVGDLDAEEQERAIREDNYLLDLAFAHPEFKGGKNRLDFFEAAVAPGASYAAQLLTCLISAKTHYPRFNTTVGAMIAALSTYLQDKKSPNGESSARSESFLWKVWRKYKPAAHLWAASYLSAADADEYVELTCDRSTEVIEFSELIRRSAEDLEIFEKDEAWRAPEQFPIGETAPNIPDLPDGFLQHLKRRPAKKPLKEDGPPVEGEEVENDECIELTDFAEKIRTSPRHHLAAHTGAIEAAMLYPATPEKRSEYHRSWLIDLMTADAEDLESFLDNPETRPFRHQFIRNVHVTPPWQEAAMQALPNFRKGIAARQVLILWLQMAEEHPETNPNPTKIIDACAKHGEALWGEAVRNTSNSVRFLTQQWVEFRSVAHLYASLFRDADGSSPVDEWPLAGMNELDDEGVIELLAIAEGMRQLAMKHKRSIGMQLLPLLGDWGESPIYPRFRAELPEAFVESVRNYRPRHSAEP